VLNEYVEEREDDVECKKLVLRVLNHCTWSYTRVQVYTCLSTYVNNLPHITKLMEITN
jgi:hypothetical protein